MKTCMGPLYLVIHASVERPHDSYIRYIRSSFSFKSVFLDSLPSLSSGLHFNEQHAICTIHVVCTISHVCASPRSAYVHADMQLRMQAVEEAGPLRARTFTEKFHAKALLLLGYLWELFYSIVQWSDSCAEGFIYMTPEGHV